MEWEELSAWEGVQANNINALLLKPPVSMVEDTSAVQFTLSFYSVERRGNGVLNIDKFRGEDRVCKYVFMDDFLYFN